MSNKKLYALAGILMITTIVFLVILKNIYINKNTGVTEEQRVMIEESGWPVQEIPVLYKPNLNVRRYSKTLQIQEISEGVSFEEFKAYLFELADSGFEADASMGCKHPSMINGSLNSENTDEFTWLAVGNGYYITAIWRKEETDVIIDNVYIELAKLKNTVENNTEGEE